MAPHIKVLSISCFYHIRSFRQIRSSLDDSTSVSVPPALIPSRLDQLNSTLYCISLKHTARLQRIQRAVARVVLYQQYRASPLSSNELCKQLHWLPIEWRIRFKLATLTSKPCTLVVRNIPDLLQHHEPTRSLRSSSSHHSAFGPPSQPIFWILCFLIFCSQSLEFITCQHPRMLTGQFLLSDVI